MHNIQTNDKFMHAMAFKAIGSQNTTDFQAPIQIYEAAYRMYRRHTSIERMLTGADSLLECTNQKHPSTFPHRVRIKAHNIIVHCRLPIFHDEHSRLNSTIWWDGNSHRWLSCNRQSLTVGAFRCNGTTKFR